MKFMLMNHSIYSSNLFRPQETRQNFPYLLVAKIYQFLSDLEKDYPNFREWYFEKVIPEISLCKRNIFIKYCNSEIGGVAIVKNSNDEKKICTVKVASDYKNRGIGVKLFQKSFEWLDCKTPLATVSEQRLPEFQRLFEHFNFKLTQIKSDYYKLGCKEYVFNGSILESL